MVPKFYFMYSTATLENMDCLISERKNLMSFQFPTNSPICTLADCHIAKSSWIQRRIEFLNLPPNEPNVDEFL